MEFLAVDANGHLLSLLGAGARMSTSAQVDDVADRATGIYQADLSASDRISERGQWRDRLAGIDDDIRRMEQQLSSAAAKEAPPVTAAINEVLAIFRTSQSDCVHKPPDRFRPGAPVAIELALAKGRDSVSARLYYRHVNQAERYEFVEMLPHGSRFRGDIPAAYTESPYPLQYYFELRDASGKAWLYPGFMPHLENQPYFVIRQISSRDRLKS